LLAIVAALAGAGPYSLAFQAVSVAAMSTLQLWRASRWRPNGWYWRRAEVKEIWGFSGGLIGFNVVNYFSRNADSMIIGRVLDAATLGAYSLAYRLMLFPVQNMTHVATRALYPVFSRNQHDTKEIGRIYVRTLGVISTITAPLMAGIFALSVQLVDVFLGRQWELVSTLLFWLAPVGFIQSLVSTTGAIFMSLNRTDLLLKLGFLSAILQVSGFVLGVQWGAEGVAKIYLIANVINAIPALYVALRIVGIDHVDFFRELWPQALSAILLILAIYFIHAIGAFAGASAVFQLTIFAGLGAAVYFASMLLIGKRRLLDLKKLVLK
ncbi:MAG: oligosaccharide flippase family protein, partial [Polynucleobacter sp.]|nr:oligosaccharide flippase family protein [Polynucleobacter sp.]